MHDAETEQRQSWSGVLAECNTMQVQLRDRLCLPTKIHLVVESRDSSAESEGVVLLLEVSIHDFCDIHTSGLGLDRMIGVRLVMCSFVASLDTLTVAWCEGAWRAC